MYPLVISTQCRTLCLCASMYTNYGAQPTATGRNSRPPMTSSPPELRKKLIRLEKSQIVASGETTSALSTSRNVYLTDTLAFFNVSVWAVRVTSQQSQAPKHLANRRTRTWTCPLNIDTNRRTLLKIQTWKYIHTHVHTYKYIQVCVSISIFELKFQWRFLCCCCPTQITRFSGGSSAILRFLLRWHNFI